MLFFRLWPLLCERERTNAVCLRLDGVPGGCAVGYVANVSPSDWRSRQTRRSAAGEVAQGGAENSEDRVTASTAMQEAAVSGPQDTVDTITRRSRWFARMEGESVLSLGATQVACDQGSDRRARRGCEMVSQFQRSSRGRFGDVKFSLPVTRFGASLGCLRPRVP